MPIEAHEDQHHRKDVGKNDGENRDDRRNEGEEGDEEEKEVANTIE